MFKNYIVINFWNSVGKMTNMTSDFSLCVWYNISKQKENNLKSEITCREFCELSLSENYKIDRNIVNSYVPAFACAALWEPVLLKKLR